ncbi:MAG: hypothetical protein IT372_38730 [Polyangiaceae bacterium]|nr:hypothetical protein [Polyangiaceae bacterium]
MKPALCLAIALTVALHAASAPAAADEGDDEGDDAPAVSGPASAEASRAEALFAAGRFGEAAPGLRRVVAGETGDAEERRQIAQHHLAIALYRLRFPNASLAVFASVAAARGHARRDEALPWLLKLAGELPEPAGAMGAIGLYGAAPLARFDGAARDELAYWQGRDAYARRAFEEAADRLERVSPASPRYVTAELQAGVARVRLRQTGRAARAFGRAEAAARRRGDAEAMRLRDVALLSMGRTYYSTSLHLGESGAPSIDPARLRAAVEVYGRVEPWGAAWQESLFEQAWVHFMVADYVRALGNLHSVDAPYFSGRVYPEADTLRALVAFVLCRYDEATTIAARSLRRYLPVRAELAALLAGQDGEGADARRLALLEEVRAGAPRVSPRARPHVEAALAARDLDAHRDHIRGIDGEIARLARAPAAFRASPLGADVADALSLARDIAVSEAAALVRARLDRALEELDAPLLDARKILADVAEARRDPDLAPVAAEDAPAPLALTGDHEIWPFDGEYWRDEVGHYLQPITSRCPR